MANETALAGHLRTTPIGGRWVLASVASRYLEAASAVLADSVLDRVSHPKLMAWSLAEHALTDALREAGAIDG